VLGTLLVGCGLALERVAGVELPVALVPPAGLATLAVLTQVTTFTGATARLTTPLVVAVAIVGIGLSRTAWRRLTPWPAVTAVVTFLAYGATVIASGQPTFAGYIKLDDTASFLALIDRVMAHGRSAAGLAPSSYEAIVSIMLGSGYPTGALLPLGVAGQLLPSDNAWLYQPYIAALGALLALSLYELASGLIRSTPLRLVVAVAAATPALLYGYALWGGVKELFAAALLPFVAATALPAWRQGTRAVAVPAVGCAALLAGLTFEDWAWLLPLVAVALLAVLRGRARIALLAALILLPVAVAAENWVVGVGSISTDTMGNLIRPLNPLQVLGVWPSGDFRLHPGDWRETQVLLAVAAFAAALGALAMWRRRAWGPLAYVAAMLAGAVVFSAFSTPWNEGKVLAMASPGLLFAALAGGAELTEDGRAIEGTLLLVTLVGGVLWSNGLAYRGVNLAPHQQLAELSTIGTRFAGQGPALMTEYQPYGVRHFLRSLDAEGASELRRHLIPLRSGGTLDKGAYADIDDFSLDTVRFYRTLVLRRSPVESRPPAPYQLVWRGRWYEVWQLAPGARRVLAHLPLGSATQPGAPAPCAQVRQLAQTASAAGGSLVAVPRDPVLDASSGVVDVPARARYSAWVGGSFRGRVELVVDGRRIATARHQLNNAGQYTPLGSVVLTPGRHAVALQVGGADLHPGSGGPMLLPGPGPVLLSSDSDAAAPVAVDPAQATRLCGRRLDWVEAIGP
jgi:hypothetical protein